MESFLPCIAELIIALIDVWLYLKVAEASDPRFDRPYQRTSFVIWVVLFALGLIALISAFVLRLQRLQMQRANALGW